MGLTNFHKGTTKTFTVLVKQNGVPINISADAVRLVVKKKKSDADGAAIIDLAADCATDGVNGNALFSISDALTNIQPRKYFYEILYNPLAGGEYVLFSDIVECLEKVAD